MTRRIEIELTARRDDGSWTWRAAGAKQPKGVVAAGIVPPDAKTGTVFRADTEMSLDGIDVLSLKAVQGRVEKTVEKVEIKGTNTKEFQAVTSELVEKKGRGKGRDAWDGGMGGREGKSDSGRGGAGVRAGLANKGRSGGPGGGRSGGDSGGRSGGAPSGGRPGGGRESGGREGAPSRGGSQGTHTAGRPTGGSGAQRTQRFPRPDRPARPVAARLEPKQVHRDEVLESLEPEVRTIAEQLLRQGLAAVRTELKARGSAADTAPLVTMAEELFPQLKAAEWLDRADAAAAMGDSISLRDLRSVVATSDQAGRNETGRAVAAELKTRLDARTEKERSSWLAEITTSLAESKLVRALRLAARPPDPATRVPADKASEMAKAAGEAMAPDVPGDRWLVVLEAVAASPVARIVKPSGLPTDLSDALRKRITAAAGRVPALAPLLGLDIPPPPPRRAGKPVAKKLPPKPPKPAAPKVETPAVDTAAEEPPAKVEATPVSDQPEASESVSDQPQASAEPAAEVEANSPAEAQLQPAAAEESPAEATVEPSPEESTEQPTADPEPEIKNSEQPPEAE